MGHTDNWKGYFERNREAFEEDLPDVEGMWQQLEDRLPRTQAPAAPKARGLRYWVAATVTLAALCTVLLVDRYQGMAEEPMLGVRDAQVQDFSGTVASFSTLIEARKTHLASYARQQGVPLESFYVDLAQLAAQYEELSITLEDTQDARVLRALIFNLELQLQLLNQQVEILEATYADVQI